MLITITTISITTEEEIKQNWSITSHNHQSGIQTFIKCLRKKPRQGGGGVIENKTTKQSMHHQRAYITKQKR